MVEGIARASGTLAAHGPLTLDAVTQRPGGVTCIDPRVDGAAGLAVVLSEVSKTFGAVRAVVRASMRAHGGRVAVIEGANGAGKSTLLAIVGTLVRPTSGSVDYGPLGATRQIIRRTLGWLGTESLCYPDLTGRQNIALSARLRGVPTDRAIEGARERFDLGAFLDRPVRTYSRGQRQRVALARALAHKPWIVLLDEPTTALDPGAVAQLVRIVRAEADRGAVVIATTHNSRFAGAIADDRFDMVRGAMRSMQRAAHPMAVSALALHD